MYFSEANMLDKGRLILDVHIKPPGINYIVAKTISIGVVKFYIKFFFLLHNSEFSGNESSLTYYVSSTSAVFS